jgi:hypothetical protein
MQVDQRKLYVGGISGEFFILLIRSDGLLR